LNSSEYIAKEDIEKIKHLNEAYLDEFTDLESDQDKYNYVTHLFRGHSEMEYGLYFGLLKAENDKDFLTNIERSYPRDINQRIIYYTDIENLLDYTDDVNIEYDFKTNLIYFNTGWQYGKKDGDSMDYNGANRDDFIGYLNSFINRDLKISELICNIPLPITLFGFVYGTMSGGSEKYKKYKIKNKKANYLPKYFY
jgi:uncharacterized protein YlaN (UPF0358 family)